MSRKINYYGSYMSGIVQSGLLMYINSGIFDSYPTTGSDWYDLTANNYDWGLINSPTFSTDNNGLLLFNGVDNRAVQNTSPRLAINTSNPFTVQFVARLDSTFGGRFPFLGVFRTTGANPFFCYYGSGTVPVVAGLNFGIGSTSYFRNVDPLPMDVFFQITIEFLGGSVTDVTNWNLEIDSVPKTIVVGVALRGYTNNFSYLGNDDAPSADKAWKGTIPVVPIYSRLLTPTEKASNANFYNSIY